MSFLLEEVIEISQDLHENTTLNFWNVSVECHVACKIHARKADAQRRRSCSHKHGLDLVVEDEHKGATGTSDNVGEAALEEGLTTLVLVDLNEAVPGTVIELILASLTGSHHESSSDGIERIRNNTSRDSDDLSEGPHGEEVSLLDILEENDLAGIEHTEVGGSVGNDTNDGDAETSVEASDTVLGGGLLEAVNETVELSLLAGTDISGESGTGEIERVDEGEGGGTSSTTGGAVTNEEHAGLGLGVVRAESLLVEVLAGEVEGLSGEITDDVSEVTSPEGTEALLLDDSAEAVTNTVVSHLNGNVGVGILDLEEELDSLDGGDDGLRDGGGNTTDEEVDHEVLFLGRSLSGHLCF